MLSRGYDKNTRPHFRTLHAPSTTPGMYEG